MTDRRSMRRFDLKLPCFISPLGQEGQTRTRWFTRNISAGGALINAMLSVPLGTKLTIKLIIVRSGQKASASNGACVTLCGEVVRNDEPDLAVEFDNQYSIRQVGKRTTNDDAIDIGFQCVDIGQEDVETKERSASIQVS